MPKGALIGRGRTAEAYEWGQDQILKLFLAWVPKGWVDYEARIGKAVFASGEPAPAVFEQLELEGRQGLIYQRVPGRMLREIAQEHLMKVGVYGRQMARLHYKIHQSVSDQLPSFKERFGEAIQQAAPILGGKAEVVMAYMRKLPDGEKVCHGDFHPDNILSDSLHDIAIDWMNAYRGDPLSDLARTYLMLTSPYLPPEIPAFVKIWVKAFRKILTRAYLKEYFRLADTDFKSVERWLLPVVAARLREHVPGEEGWLLALIDQEISKLGLAKDLKERDA